MLANWGYDAFFDLLTGAQPMSKDDQHQLKELVRQGRVRMLTIDTNIAVQYGLGLNRGLLAQLVQFKTGRFRFVLSEIVIREIQRRIAEKLEEDRTEWKRIFRKLRRVPRLREQVDALDKGVSALNSEEQAKRQVDQFIIDTGADIISAREASMETVLDLYFDRLAPFDASGKRSEFPDAIALLGLKAWAEAGDCGVIVVSEDGDWRRYCEQPGNEQLFILKSLATALEIVNSTADERAARVAVRQEELAKHLRDDALRLEIQRELQRQLLEVALARGTSQPFAYIADIVRIDVGPISFARPALVRDDDAKFVVLADIEARCEFWANFTFYDPELSVEKGRGVYMYGRPIQAGLLITAEDNGISTEVILNQEADLIIDFGEVEPDSDDIQSHLPL